METPRERIGTILGVCYSAVLVSFRRIASATLQSEFGKCRICSGFWSGRRDSNPRPRPWQGRALPLSYTRVRWIYGRAMSAAKAEPIPRSTAPMQPVAKGAKSVAGGPLFPRILARRGADPAGVHVTEPAISGQNGGLACRERPILAIFVDVAGSDIDVGAPGALGGPRRPSIE